MRSRTLRFIVLIGLGGGLCRLPASGPALPFTPPAAADLATAVANLQNRYASVRTVSADFRQTYRAPGMQQIESGVLLMKKPGLMRWEYRDPEVKLFVADGSTSYLYAPQDRQVMVSRLSADDLRSTPLQFLLGRGRIAEAYDASWESEVKPHVEGTLLLRLAPRVRSSEYAYLVVEFDERNFDLRRIVIREQTGNTSEFLLTNLQTDVRIDDKNFRFKIPKGVEVVRLDEK